MADDISTTDPVVEKLERRIATLELLLGQRLPPWRKSLGHHLITSDEPIIAYPYEGLACPRCGEDYLHHSEIIVFDRHEDADWTVVTSVVNGLVSSHRLPSTTCLNPSDRRHGVSIGFWCENCSSERDYGNDSRASIWLGIAQHKGVTYLSWRYEPRKDREETEGS